CARDRESITIFGVVTDSLDVW
nr:immunoglobulin heavy chain junction region [Macaca mulatta]